MALRGPTFKSQVWSFASTEKFVSLTTSTALGFPRPANQGKLFETSTFSWPHTPKFVASFSVSRGWPRPSNTGLLFKVQIWVFPVRADTLTSTSGPFRRSSTVKNFSYKNIATQFGYYR